MNCFGGNLYNLNGGFCCGNCVRVCEIIQVVGLRRPDHEWKWQNGIKTIWQQAGIFAGHSKHRPESMVTIG